MSALILVNLLIASRTHLQAFYFIFWFLVTLVALSFLYVTAVLVTAQLSITRTVTDKIEEDDVLKLCAQVENKGMFPLFNLVIEDTLACASLEERHKRMCVDDIQPHSSRLIRYQCRCPKRGIFGIGPFAVYFFDPLGLFFLRKEYPLASELRVHPKTFLIRKFPELRRGMLPWFGIETVRVSGDDDEFFGVREYRGGDPIKKIHWISTARKSKLIVKQFQRQGFFRATILFTLERENNFGEGKDSVAEYMIKIAASVARYLIEHNIAVELIAHDGELVHIPSSKGSQHLESLFTFFSKAQAHSTVSLGEMFEESFRYTPDDSSVIVIMLDQDWEYLIKVLRLEKRSVYVIPLILISSSFKYAFAERDIAKEIKIRLGREINFMPLMFSRGDNLEEAFLRQ